jgi:REP element-mobilizing transposase RayT
VPLIHSKPLRLLQSLPECLPGVAQASACVFNNRWVIVMVPRGSSKQNGLRPFPPAMGTKTKIAAGSGLIPGGFQDINPWHSDSLSFKRRNLPHLEVCGATYFVTFRSKIELPPPARDLTIAEIQACDEISIELDAAVVMPDHVHAIFRLLNDEKMSHVLQMIKGRSARRINQLLRRAGRVWLDESFDHVIRTEEELSEKIEYIRQNAVNKGLAIRPNDYRWVLLR